MKHKLIFATLALIAVAGSFWWWKSSTMQSKLADQPRRLKLYWFIPDGVRAEPDLFDVFTWAKEGKLPNIKRMMEKGSYGYSYPNFPSHTPTNFATLLTGMYPESHGVNDGPMHMIGKPLDTVAVSGFRSSAKKVEPIWTTLEKAGMKVALLSVPGSTPPEIQNGAVIKGRWGGWGADFPALIFETKRNITQRTEMGTAARFFYFGSQLTNFIEPSEAIGWDELIPKGFSPPLEIAMNGWGAPVYGYIYDSSDDKQKNYDRIIISLDKKKPNSDLKSGERSIWIPITLKWVVGDTTQEVPTHMYAHVIKMDSNGFFRVRIVYDALNSTLTFPSELASILQLKLGPMVDYPDTFPPQLVYYPEDKKVFETESTLSFDWHTRAVSKIHSILKPDVIIHDIYTPNQMLTSKWWMGAVDPKGDDYALTSQKDRDVLWKEVQDMYVNLDTMVGEILATADHDTYIVFSSDHGNVPLNVGVNLNNLFAKKGWLKFTVDPNTGESVVDWENTRVIYLKMAHVYINTHGLSGNYTRDSGPEYEALRDEVIDELKELTYSDGVKPVADIVKYTDVVARYNMDPDRSGDLVIANTPGFGWQEDMTASLQIFSEPRVTGYKQAILSEQEKGMWTPFIISGPGIKAGNYLGDTAFPLVDQYPTIMKALGVEISTDVQGSALPVFADK